MRTWRMRLFVQTRRRPRPSIALIWLWPRYTVSVPDTDENNTNTPWLARMLWVNRRATTPWLFLNYDPTFVT